MKKVSVKIITNQTIIGFIKCSTWNKIINDKFYSQFLTVYPSRTFSILNHQLYENETNRKIVTPNQIKDISRIYITKINLSSGYTTREICDDNNFSHKFNLVILDRDIVLGYS